MFTHQKEYKDEFDDEKKAKMACELITKGIISLFNFVTLILLIVWLSIIIHNANEEPESFSSFVDNEFSVDYSEGDFCYGHKFEFSRIGAFELFHIRMGKIKKYSIGLLVSKIISFLLVNIDWCAILVYLKCSSMRGDAEKNMMIFGIVFTICSLINSILNIVFFEKFSQHFSDSNFEDFEKFSDCDYLIGAFKEKYDFITTVKKSGERISVVNLISSIFEAFNCF